MFRRPKNVDEGRENMRIALERTAHRNKEPIYETFWRCADVLMLKSRFVDYLIKPLCDTSQVTTFLYNTLIPIVEELISNPEKCVTNFDAGLSDTNCPQYVKNMYEHIQSLIQAATHAKTRTDLDDDSIKTCADVVIEIFADENVCDAMRLLAISNVFARIAFDISAPRMINTFYNEKTLVAEGLSFDIVSKFSAVL